MMKRYLLCILLLMALIPLSAKAENCRSYTLDEVTKGNKTVICIAQPTGQSGVESHHRFVKNMYSNYNSVLVVNTVVYMGGNTMPAYCVNEDKHGVGDKALDSPGAYSVTLKDWNSFVSLVGSNKANKVRNIILNGYPLKSASELGFNSSSQAENSYDAFTATKLAVFTVLNVKNYSLGNEGLTYYKPAAIVDNGARGTKIVQKIKDFVRYSDTAPANARDVAFTEGTNKEEGSYITKTFTVNPPMGGKLVVNLKNAPSGTLIDGVAGTSKTYTNSGYYGSKIDVKVSVPTANVAKSGMNMTVDLTYTYRTLELFYGDSGNSYQSYIITKPITAKKQQTYKFNSDPKKRTCDDVDKEYKECIKDKSCSDALKKEYEACHPRTCDNVIKEYKTCSDCEKVVKKYNACNKNNSCSDAIKKEYNACKEANTLSCSDKLKKEYEGCHERTCDEVKSEYTTCTICAQVKAEYDICSKDKSCSQEILSKYEECDGNFVCSDELTKEYNACYPKERTCDDIIDEYLSCDKKGNCSDKLLKEYQNCVPANAEENPNTMGANVILLALLTLGGIVIGYRSYKRRLALKSELD